MAENEGNIFNNFFELFSQVARRDFSSILQDWSSNQTIQGADYSHMFSNGLIFQQYESFDDAFGEIEKLRAKPNRTAAEEEALQQVTSDDYETLESTNSFFNRETAGFRQAKDVASAIIGNAKELVNLGGIYSNDRIIITEDKKGVFDFSLASQGLFRPVEYYSQELADEIKSIIMSGGQNPFMMMQDADGVVPPNLVQSIEGSEQEKIFYYEVDKKKYICERRQKGTTRVFEEYPEKCLLKPNSQGVILPYQINNQEKVFNGKGKIRLKYASSNKKSYLMYEKQPDSTKYVDIFVPINFLSTSDGNRILNVLTPILVSSTLESYGIQTRISAVRMGSDGGVFTAIAIPVKDYNETTKEKMDFLFNVFGKMGVASSFFSFFKIYNSNSGNHKDQSGTPIQSGDLSPAFHHFPYERRGFVYNEFSRYKNWAKENEGKPFINTKVINNNFQFFTFQAVVPNSEVPFFPAKAVADARGLIGNIQYVMFMFYFYMDYLAIEFLPLDRLVNQIMVRWEEDDNFRKIFNLPSARAEKKQIMRQYLVNLLVEKYTYTETGAYSDTPEQIQEKKDRFDQKVSEINQALNNM